MSEDSDDTIARLQQRIAELEMLVLHFQRDFSTLNEVVLHQARSVEQLRRQVDTFNERMKFWQHRSEQQTADEEPPPPHY